MRMRSKGMRSRRMRFLPVLFGSGGGGTPAPEVTRIFEALFDVDDAAPLTSPYVAETGEFNVIDSGNNLAVSTNALRWPANASNFDPSLGGRTSLARAVGRTLKTKYTYTGADNRGNAQFGFHSAATTTTGGANTNRVGVIGIFEDEFIVVPTPATAYLFGVATDDTDYQFATRLKTAGFDLFMKTGAGSWQLVWSDDTNTTDPLYPAMICVNTVDRPNANGVVLYYVIDDYSDAFATDYGIADVNITAFPMAEQSMNVSSQIDFFYTLPSTPTSGDKIGIEYRKDGDGFQAYITYTGSAWDFKLDRIDSGSPTTLITAAGVGATNKIRVRVNGDSHECWTFNTSNVQTKRGTTQTDANYNTQTGADEVFSLTNATGSAQTRFLSHAISKALYDTYLNAGIPS